MSAAAILRAERAAMCDTFDAVGPDAPTLCDAPDVDAFLWRTLALTGRVAARKVRPFGLELDGASDAIQTLRDAKFGI